MAQQTDGLPSPHVVALLQRVPPALAYLRKLPWSGTRIEVRSLYAVGALLYSACHAPLYAWARLRTEPWEARDLREKLVSAADDLTARHHLLLAGANDGATDAPRGAILADLLEMTLYLINYNHAFFPGDGPAQEHMTAVQYFVDALLQSRTAQVGGGQERIWPWWEGGPPSLSVTRAATMALIRCKNETYSSASPFKLAEAEETAVDECLHDVMAYLERYLRERVRPQNGNRASVAVGPAEVIGLAQALQGVLFYELTPKKPFRLGKGIVEIAAKWLIDTVNDRPYLPTSTVYYAVSDIQSPGDYAGVAVPNEKWLEERNGLAVVLRTAAEVYRLLTYRQAEARRAGWLFEESFSKQRAHSSLCLLGRQVVDLQAADTTVWWQGRFDAEATLWSVVSLTESAEAIWEAQKQGIEPALSKDDEDAFRFYQGVRQALSNEAVAHDLAASVAREMKKALGFASGKEGNR